MRGPNDYQGRAQYRQGGGRVGAEPDAISAPYNFVPVSKDVVFPGWADAVSHDVPFEDGLCGSFEIQVEATSPLIIRGEKPKGNEPAEFVRDPRGAPYIPGTSLRGLLRNTVEIIGFGKLGRVDDKTYGLRDLQNRHTYVQHMAEIQNRQPTPLVNAGWLTRGKDGESEETWQIEPCHFAKVEYGLLTKLGASQGIKNYNPGRKQGAVDKYKAWGDRAFMPFTCPVKIEVKGGARAKGGAVRLSDYGKVAAGPQYQGQLVFTGQPQERRAGDTRKKHHDFFFFGQAGPAISVSEKVRGAFENVHRDAGQQGRDDVQPNPEWGFWRRRLRMGEKVPVFFLTTNNPRNPRELRAFGLAMMFRLAYDLSTKDVVRNAQRDSDSPKNDLAELVFGYVQSEAKADSRDDALRGRVSIGDGKLQGVATNGSTVTAVLNAPKPTFYPNYIEQGERGPKRGSGGYEWQTYMKDGDPKARGWKRYIARHEYDETPYLPPKAGDSVKTRFKPLMPGVKFKATVRVHNLRPMELGALLWATTFGDTAKARHLLGQGRSLGYGACKLTVSGLKLRANDGCEVPSAQKLMDRFEGYMEAMLPGGWRKSRQIFELLAMATPGGGRDEKYIRHMQLDHRVYRNEFNASKKAGLALPKHGGEGGYKQWLKEAKAQVAEVDVFEVVGKTRRDLPDGSVEPEQRRALAVPVKKAQPAPVKKASTPATVDALQFKLAYSAGTYAEVLKTWLKAGGPLLEARRQIALGEIKKISNKFRRRHPELVAWLEG